MGARTQDALESAEADYGLARTAELMSRPVRATGDLRHLRAIHGRLFQDVYDWAGQLRTVDIRKGNDPAAEFFMPVSRLQTGAGYVFQELDDDRQLRGLSPDRFIERLAHHYDQVNYLHPFREGNGRTQRLFWTQISAAAGYELDWRGVTGAVNDQASRDAMERRDLSGLRTMFEAIVRPPSSGTSVDSAAARVRLFANLDLPVGGIDVSSSSPRTTTRRGGGGMRRGPDTGLGR
ncbi:MAG: Fic family protein [Salinibacterium sp.]|nr:Fic family protein [Salinibacterium sp.]